MMSAGGILRSNSPRGKRKTQDPCPGCGLHRLLCICSAIPSLQLATRVSLIIHKNELRRTTNTGQLALRALKNSEMVVRGRVGEPQDLGILLNPNYRTFLFFPSDTALVLTPELVRQSSLPIHLLVPDGNWRQASKVHYRHQELKEVPRLTLAPLAAASQTLRLETRANGQATLQAIAEALRIIEGEEVGQSLLSVYEKKLQNTLKGRGRL